MTKSFVSSDVGFFSTQDGCVSCLRAYLGARLLPQSYQYPNFSEGADCVAGQLHGGKECPFSGVTKSGSLEEGAGKRCSECVRTPLFYQSAQCHKHTPSIAFGHLPPNSARFSYATEWGSLYLRAAVHRRGQRPPKVWLLI